MIPDYRTYPDVKFPAFVEDGAQAVRWARAHARDFGGDPDRLFVMGHSAGAHIAALLALDGSYLAAAGGSRQWLAGMIGLAGPYDFLPIEDDDLKAIFGPPERYAQSQPINFVDGHNPPMLLLHGKTDITVYARNTVNLAAKIREKGGPVQSIIYPVMSHVRIVACMAAPIRFTGPTLDDVSRFIQQTAGHEPGKPPADGDREPP
jgi:acetyl esterase/lipase